MLVSNFDGNSMGYYIWVLYWNAILGCYCSAITGVLLRLKITIILFFFFTIAFFCIDNAQIGLYYLGSFVPLLETAGHV